MKNLWIINALTLPIVVANILFFQWIFDGNLYLSLFYTFLFLILSSLLLLIVEEDKKWFVTAGFSVLAVWLSIKFYPDPPTSFVLNVITDMSVALFAGFMAVVLMIAKDIKGNRFRFLMIASEVVHCGLVFGIIQLTCSFIGVGQTIGAL